MISFYFLKVEQVQSLVPYYYFPTIKNLQKESLSIGRNAYELLYFGQPKESLNLAKLAVKINNKDQQLWLFLSETQVANKLYKNALISLKKAEKIDILINNAGFLVNKPFKETTLEDFQMVYSTNVFSVAMLIKNTIDFMESGSNVLNISSIGGIQGSLKFPGLSAYSSSKGALNILTEMLAEEYKDRGIHFNSLALGSVQTKMLEKAFPNFTASTSALEMAEYIYNFSTNGYKLMNGKVVSVSSTTP